MTTPDSAALPSGPAAALSSGPAAALSSGPAAALSFGPAAQQYDEFRPSYPPAALTWALGTEPRRVVDLGAGTGKLTRVLLSLGHDVVPVEPDPQMRELLARRSAGVRPLAGTAEQIPLPDGSVDAVLAGQAYHWFNPGLAHPEIGRVLRPGGVFAPVWNLRDESVPWVARVGEVIDDRQHEAELLEPAGLGPLFGPVASKTFRHEVPMTADRLVALLSTRSYFLVAPPQQRAALAEQIRAVTVGLPEMFPLPYRTIIYRAIRSARTPSADRPG
jgi:SAM-dependent methyltransferase